MDCKAEPAHDAHRGALIAQVAWAAVGAVGIQGGGLAGATGHSRAGDANVGTAATTAKLQSHLRRPCVVDGGPVRGKTRLGERCKLHRSSWYAVAEPLRRGERFCGHHHPDKYTGVCCAGMKNHGKGRCRVWSGSFYADAAPLRRGSPFCHHHRVRCNGLTRAGTRCTVTSSSEHTHADPLRQGEQFCAHHLPSVADDPVQPGAAENPTQLPCDAAESNASDSFELYDEDFASEDVSEASADSFELYEELLYDSDGVWQPNANYAPRVCRACGELRRYCECGAEHSTSGSESESDSSEDYRNVPSMTS